MKDAFSRYLQQLRSDIDAACGLANRLPLHSVTEGLEGTFAEIERWLSGGPYLSLSDYCSLESHQFPPPDRLSDQQIREFIQAIRKLLASWRLSVDIPDICPLSLQYEILVSLLGEPIFIPGQHGLLRYELCSYYPAECRLKAYCQCRKYLEEQGEI